MRKFYKILVVFLLAVSVSGCITKLNIHTLNQKASEYMAKDDYDSAIARLVSINDLDPNYPEAHYNLAIAYIRKGDYEKALPELHRAVELKNDMIDAYYSLGVVNEELADRKIVKLKKTKVATDKASLKQQISKHVEEMFESYEKYINLASEDYEKEQVKGQFDFLKEKYQEYIIIEPGESESSER